MARPMEPQNNPSLARTSADKAALAARLAEEMCKNLRKREAQRKRCAAATCARAA